MACSGSSAEQGAEPAVPPMRWWGWGDPGHPPVLSGEALRHVAGAVGLSGPPCPPVALGSVKLPDSGLGESALSQLRDALGACHVRLDRSERVLHAAGRGYLDLVRLRSGELEGAPDAVLHPRTPGQLRAILEICARSSIAVVPFGGGTSVVGGLAPLSAGHDGVVSLDLASLRAIAELDRESLTVTAGAGLRVAALERALAGQGLTLGHFPQSFEHVSVGGCAATRSAGQASCGYGRFEQMVLGLKLAAPAGQISLPAMPASAAGPDLRDLLVGSEGTLGVIEEVCLRVRRAPEEKVYEAVLFGDFHSGTEALRQLAQEGRLPAVARLSEEGETRMSIAMAGSGGLKGRLGRLYVGARGYRDGCLAILGFEGEPERVRAQRRHAIAIARRHGALPIGRGPGEAWRASRFTAPYMRDELMTHGVMVETLETATTWSALHRLRERVTDAISDALSRCGTPGLVGCHVSHVYETGASLYFTFLARQLPGEPERQWHEVKRAAGEAILAGGGTITHHHGVGRDHAPWLPREIGQEGIAALRALKNELDPSGIMNPGKLLEPAGA